MEPSKLVWWSPTNPPRNLCFPTGATVYSLSGLKDLLLVITVMKGKHLRKSIEREYWLVIDG